MFTITQIRKEQHSITQECLIQRHRSVVQRQLRIAGTLVADRQMMFPLKVLSGMQVPRYVHSSVQEQLELDVYNPKIKLYGLLKPTEESSALAKANESCVKYETHRTLNTLEMSNRIGRLKCIVSSNRSGAAVYALIQAYNVSDQLDLGLNPLLIEANHWDLVEVTSVKLVVNVQHHCTERCIPVLSGGLRLDLHTLSVPRSVICHDANQTTYVLNKHRLK
jgi:hypothetical protein